MTYSVAVRALCEFAAKTGDLDLRFTPSPSAREGIAGHLQVSARRHKDYEKEVPLSGSYRELQVRGRADGYDPRHQRLEEVKTYRGNLHQIPVNHTHLHWAQAKVYAALLCRERGLDRLQVGLVYFDIVEQKETLLTETHTAEALDAFFTDLCQRFYQWAKQEVAHRERRDKAMEALDFPHAAFRSGQRPLAEAVYQSAATGRSLLMQAPTGIGKTLGTLFPLCKALPRQALDKIYFLSAKTPGRQLALEASQSLGCKTLRTLELVAREKSCEHPDKACHGESCPLAEGFYDRLSSARAEAANETLLNQSHLRDIALKHQVCPYYLGQEMARWSDVIVGDYNYYFDLGAMLHGLTQVNQWKAAILVDEAHNLVDRARDMYTGELDQTLLRRAKKQSKGAIKKALEKLNRHWNALNRRYEADYAVLDDLPVALCQALQAATAVITDKLAETPETLDSDQRQCYFDMLKMLRLIEHYDAEAFIVDLTRYRTRKGREARRLCLRNLIPADLLKPRFETAHSATLFSATLQPAGYYKDLLGMPPDTVYQQVGSPFDTRQLHVHITRNISTRFRDRAASVAPIARLIADQFDREPGNYLAFFSSYHYLEQVKDHLLKVHPHVPAWAQNRHMDEDARRLFLDRFKETQAGVGFAVLGGAFSEGIDLPGKRLIGAFVATLGLPQVNAINEQLKQRMTSAFGDGYRYAYLYPGLRKVAQAAGRVIRTEQDEGTLYLIDDRFDRPDVRSLLPDWWTLE